MSRKKKKEPAKKLRVLALVHPDLVPPADADPEELPGKPWKTEYDVVRTLETLGHEVQILGVGDELGGIRNALFDFKPHITFNLLEGFDDIVTFDHNVVAYLELLKMPYTGCNSRGLLLWRDKSLAKKLLTYHRVPGPDFAIFPRGRKVRHPKRLAFPLFVKSLTMDASIGISQASVVDDEEHLEERVRFIHESVGTDALVERYIEGRELYVGVIGNQQLVALDLVREVRRGGADQLVDVAVGRLGHGADGIGAPPGGLPLPRCPAPCRSNRPCWTRSCRAGITAPCTVTRRRPASRPLRGRCARRRSARRRWRAR